MSQHDTHKYKRIDIGVNKTYIVYACQLNCSHYVIPAQVVGKLTLCWKCLKPFELKKSNLKVKPTCQDCKSIRESKKQQEESDGIMKVLGF